MPDSNATPADVADMITYEEAAVILDRTVETTRNMVARSTLHAFPDPQDRKRRLLLRSEVEARAQYLREHKRGIKPSETAARARMMEHVPHLSADEAKLFAKLAGGVVLAAASIYLLAASNDARVRTLALTMLVSLALLALVEMEKAREIDAIQRRQLEQRVAELEAAGDVTGLGEIIDMGERVAKRAALGAAS